MKAVICTKYGPPEVLKLAEVEKPIPKRDEVLVKIHASAVTMSDIYIRGLEMPMRYRIAIRLMIGLRKPRRSVIGLVLAGEIESVGNNVTRFKQGDQVYGLTGFKLGAYAEYTCMKEKDSKIGALTLKPSNISYGESTAAAYGGLLALQYLEKGNFEQAKKILIYGASGTSGTIAVQIAKSYGAEVTGVCSTSNLEMVKSLGADKVIDYTKQNTIPNDEKYDLVLDAVGKMKTSKLKNECKKALTPSGRYVSIDDSDLKLDSHRLNRLRELVEAGKFMPVIDKTYPLEEIVDAHRYVGKGHKKGGVVINVINEN